MQGKAVLTYPIDSFSCSKAIPPSVVSQANEKRNSLKISLNPLADPPDGLDIVQLEVPNYSVINWHIVWSQWAPLRQSKDNQDVYKRFLFHYSRTQEATHPVKTRFPPMHPLMHLAAQLANRRIKRFLQQGLGTAAVDFTKKDSVVKASWIQ
ncbi:Neuromedin-S [Plecturocebus cupreus]